MKRLAIFLLVLPWASCRRAVEAPPPIRIDAAAESRSAVVRPRRVFALYPSRARAGTGFQVQEGGDSAMLLTGWGFTPGDRVFWNGAPLATTFSEPTTISALVPKAFLDRPGDVRVEVRGPADSSAGSPSAVFTVTR
jgi:hypothetical protein